MDEPPKPRGSWEGSEGSWCLERCEERLYMWNLSAELGLSENPATAAENVRWGLVEVVRIAARLGDLVDPAVRS